MYTTKKHSESSFSNGGQILIPHRSRLLLDTCGHVNVSPRLVMEQHGR